MRFDRLREQFDYYFHPRKLLVVSDERVHQLRIGVALQVCVVLTLAFGTVWSCYATGKFFITQARYDEQTTALTAVTNVRTGAQGMMSSVLGSSSQPKEDYAPMDFSALSEFGKNPMFARVALLEQKVSELTSA